MRGPGVIVLMVLMLAAPGAGAEFPSAPLLDDFERPDQVLSDDPRWADAWNEFGGLIADRSHSIDAGRIRSTSGGATPPHSGGSAWLPLVADDVEAYVTWSVLGQPPSGGGRGSEIQVRTQSLPDGHLHYYSCEYLVIDGAADRVRILWQRDEGDQQAFAGVNLSDDFAASDVVGIRMLGDRLECWRRHATSGNGFQAGESELMSSFSSMPGGLGPGYVVLRTTDLPDIRWDDFGASVLPVPEPEPEPETVALPALTPIAVACLLLASGARRAAGISGARGATLSRRGSRRRRRAGRGSERGR